MSTYLGPDQRHRDPIDASAVLAERRHLINVAYRLLGSLGDAEDAVQEAYARWTALSGDQRSAIVSPGAWMVTVTSRICLDLLGSARARRERYVGNWLPEPLPGQPPMSGGRLTGSPTDPADRITLDESIDMAFLVVLEAMTPAERVAFLLHDVFGYSFAEIAEIVGRSPGACRQLASSARGRVREERPVSTPTGQRAKIIRDFKQAWEAKDIAALVQLLDPSASATGDGGGIVPATLHPIEGRERIAEYVTALGEKISGLALTERIVNGQPGLVGTRDGVIETVFAFEITGSLIRRVFAIRNPEKLRAWTT